MKKLKYILLSVFCIGALSVHAEDEVAKLLAKQVEELTNSNKELQAKIESLEKEKVNLNEQITNLKEELRKSQDESKVKNKNKELEKQNADLMKEIERLKADSLKMVQAFENQLKSEKAEYEEQIASVKSEMDEVKKNNDALQRFAADYLVSLVESPNVWASKSYSEIDMDELKKEAAKYEKYSTENEKIGQRYNELEALLKEAALYNSAYQAIDQEYDKDMVAKALKELETINPSTEPRNNEVKSLRKKLNDYEVTVEIFQEVIASVDKTTDGVEGEDLASQYALNKLNRQEIDNGNISAIKDIPWLARMYDDYLKIISKNPFAPNPAKETIMGIKL